MKTKKTLTMGIVAIISLFGVVALANSTAFLTDVVISITNASAAAFSSNETNPGTKPELSQLQQIPARPPVQQSISNETKEIPEYVLYEQVFRLTIEFNDLAKSQEAKGEAVTQFRSYFKDEAKLTAQENEFLTQTANNFDQELKVITGQAEVVIQELRQQFASRPEGQLIQPSPELLELQEKRNKLALLYRDKLKDLLGIDKFNEFDGFVKGSFAAGFHIMPVQSTSDSDNKGGKK